MLSKKTKILFIGTIVLVNVLALSWTFYSCIRKGWYDDPSMQTLCILLMIFSTLGSLGIGYLFIWPMIKSILPDIHEYRVFGKIPIGIFLSIIVSGIGVLLFYLGVVQIGLVIVIIGTLVGTILFFKDVKKTKTCNIILKKNTEYTQEDIARYLS